MTCSKQVFNHTFIAGQFYRGYPSGATYANFRVFWFQRPDARAKLVSAPRVQRGCNTWFPQREARWLYASDQLKLNEFLSSRDVSPVRHTVTVPWDEASERTRRRPLRKTQQAVSAVLEEVAPKQSEKLWYSLVPSLTQKFSTDSESEDKDVDNVLMNALTECCSNASAWDTRWQVLSIMADKVTFQTLKKWIPDLTRYRSDSVLQESIQCFTGEVFHHHKHPTQNCSCHPHRLTTSWISLPVLTLSRICHSVRRRSHCQQMRLWQSPTLSVC